MKIKPGVTRPAKAIASALYDFFGDASSNVKGRKKAAKKVNRKHSLGTQRKDIKKLEEFERQERMRKKKK